MSGATERSVWLNGWRLALRMGRRDVRRHLARSLLVVVMVAFPVAALTAGNTFGTTSHLTATESLPFTLGTAQARVTLFPMPVRPLPVEPYAIPLDPDSHKPVPGQEDPADQTSALQRLLPGATLSPVSTYFGAVRGDGRTRAVAVLGIDPRTSPATGIVSLKSGRWAETSTEVVITRHGVALGLPSSGTLQIPAPGQDMAISDSWTSYTIVGIADAWIDQGNVAPAAAVILHRPGETASWLVDRTEPVLWPEIKRLAESGVSVKSRAVILDPPADSDWKRPGETFGDSMLLVSAVWSGYLGALLLVETILLVGPAFAVSAARQRRTLALSALNGAPVAQLRRMVLGQAVVLGVVSALVGALIGVVGTYGYVSWIKQKDLGQLPGPFEVPWAIVAGVVAAAIISSVVAALIPSRGLDRLDLVGVLRGQVVSPTPSVRTPLAGLVLAGAGALALVIAVSLPRPYDQVSPALALLGLLALVGGALMLTPTILVLLSRLLRRAPVPLKMAARDAARQRGRATSTVAAILGAVMLYTVVVVQVATSSELGRRTYIPQTVPGHGLVNLMYGTTSPARATEVERQVVGLKPGLVIRRESVVSGADPATSGTPGQAPSQVESRRRLIVALRAGCTPEHVVEGYSGPSSLPCWSLTSDGGTDRSSIEVSSVDDLVARYHLPAEAKRALSSGGIVVVTDKVPHDPNRPRPQHEISSDDTLTFVDGTVSYDQAGATWVSPPKTVRLPAYGVAGTQVIRTPDALRVDPDMAGPGALLSDATAARLGWPTMVRRLHVEDPAGPIDWQTEQRINEAMLDSGVGTFYVERGYQAMPLWLFLVIAGVVGTIILVGSLVSTALSTAELAPFMGTLAAVGATRTTRRLLAASQAWLLAVVGAVLGIGVGLVPGIVIGRQSTSYIDGETRSQPFVVIPWDQLAVPGVVIPLVAAALAYVAVRRSPAVTRRTG